ncbi:VOC family protein (plasmid) [Streptomyces sp. NBC_01795]|uniref:VOC family protein n=1 Tax=unclassified Streptomyces TaxID=2593676 RepID=UPI002DDA09ED|nr:MULTISPECIES: VOC family protein [unclassified Streptomyces]WSA97628.1 VOC family protein [Streptomyces sp. NBC_01795]WSB82122.1 VOC family protein [Streptomyces sp. NBC_01775]WSS18093.1 VOC family protein [Streptomyces sp. NBC_01186]
MTAHDEDNWPHGLDVQQVRVARPTDRLEEIARFYRDGLGLAELFRFQEHAGYDGVMLGLPGKPYHLEFTQHVDGSPCPAPTKDNLLVFYTTALDAMRVLVDRLSAMGHPPVKAENPYWEENGAVTIEDPDGWRVVLVPSEGI